MLVGPALRSYPADAAVRQKTGQQMAANVDAVPGIQGSDIRLPGRRQWEPVIEKVFHEVQDPSEAQQGNRLDPAGGVLDGKGARAHAAESGGQQVEPTAEVEVGAARRRIKHGHSPEDPAFGKEEQVVHGPFRGLVGCSDDDVAYRGEMVALGPDERAVKRRPNIGPLKTPQLLGMRGAE